MASGLGWDPLKTRREKHIVKLVKNCLDGQAPSYFSDYIRRRTYDIHDYDTRSKDRLSIDKVNLEPLYILIAVCIETNGLTRFLRAPIPEDTFRDFIKNYLVVNSVKGLLQINKDYTIKKISINIDTPAIVCLQQGSKGAV
ncbi:unnamed protein product [Porites evermanni]|uniref:LAGLIDADG endonuclease n=1 Tax=Porites evermanni TaxID=104178 RepID=A0ABN8RYH8_9CNID|nr:unnamed protein product [Porites evermanni]